MYKCLFSPIEKDGGNVSVSPPPIKPQFGLKQQPLTSNKRKCYDDSVLPKSKK